MREILVTKSHSFRALIMAALAEGTSRITAPAISADWLRGTEALEMFGAIGPLLDGNPSIEIYEDIASIPAKG